ncbi:MAG: hypothetical protein Q7R93_02930 [bacterium]|nr:hypothetical protein [bacterium]
MTTPYSKSSWFTNEFIIGDDLMSQMIAEVFVPLRNRISSAYPIPELQDRFSAALEDPMMTFSLASRKSDIHGKGFKGEGPLAFSGPRPDGTAPAAIFIAENFRRRIILAYGTWSNAEAEKYLEDLFLAVYLHEYYHIQKQNVWRLSLSNSEIVESEKDCWAYTCRDILIPMQKGGRGKLIPGTQEHTILSVYREVNGDTNSAVWDSWIRTLYEK